MPGSVDWGGNTPSEASLKRHLPSSLRKTYGEPLSRAIEGVGDQGKAVTDRYVNAQSIQGLLKKDYDIDPLGHSFVTHLQTMFRDIVDQIKGFIQSIGYTQSNESIPPSAEEPEQ